MNGLQCFVQAAIARWLTTFNTACIRALFRGSFLLFSYHILKALNVMHHIHELWISMHQTLPGLRYLVTTLDTTPGDIREELRPKRWFMVIWSLTFRMLPDTAPAHLSNDKYLLLIPWMHVLLQTILITHCFLDMFPRIFFPKVFISLCLLQGLVKYHLLRGTFSASLAGRHFPFHWVPPLTSYHA